MMKQLSALGNGDDTTDYVNGLMAREDFASVKRYSDQIQKAFQEKCIQQVGCVTPKKAPLDLRRLTIWLLAFILLLIN